MILWRRYLAQFCRIDVVLGFHVIHGVHRIRLIVFIWNILALIHEVVARIGRIKTLAAKLIVLKDVLRILGAGIEAGVSGIRMKCALLL